MIDDNQYPWVEVGYKKKDEGFKRHIWINKIEKHNLTKIKEADVYVTYWEYSSQQNNKPNVAPHIGPFIADCDGSDLEKTKEDTLRIGRYFNIYYEIPYESQRFYFTGAKGFRPVIPYECFLSDYIPNLERIFKGLAKFIKVHAPSMDLAVYDHARLIRVPNTVNQKSGLYQIPLTYDELKNLSIDEIKRLAESPREIEVKEPVFSRKLNGALTELSNMRPQSVLKYEGNYSGRKVTLDTLPRKYQYLLTTHGEGDRNPSLCQLVGLFKTCGLTYEEAREEILEFNRRFCSPSKSDEEALIPLEFYYHKGGQ